MLDLTDLTIFVRIVETESLTKAAASLGLPKSAISRRVSRLEEGLGVQLLNRSTRAVTATQDGALFHSYCIRSLGILREGERALYDRHQAPLGLVRIAIPYVLGQSLIGPLLADYLEHYPDVRIVSVLSDDPVGLLRAGFDVAIAPGPLADSGLTATKLGTTECGLFATPDYLERKGVPQSHIELPRFDLLAMSGAERRERWTLHSDAGQALVDFLPRLTCNDFIMLRHAVLSGLGIAALPAFLCRRDIAEGNLQEILPDWHIEDLSFFAVFAEPKGIPSSVRTLIDYLVGHLRPILSWELH